MNIERGGIYEVDKEWKPDNLLLNKRPVIAIKSSVGSIEGVFIGILPSSSNRMFQLTIEYESSGEKRISVVACDKVYEISNRFIKQNLGYVSDEVLESIDYMIKEFKNESNIKLHEKTINILNGFNLTNEKKFDELFKRITIIGEDTIKTNDIVEKANNKIAVWKERFIGFVLGVAASLVASGIWEKRNELLQEIYSFIIKLVQIFTSHQN